MSNRASSAYDNYKRIAQAVDASHPHLRADPDAYYKSAVRDVYRDLQTQYPDAPPDALRKDAEALVHAEGLGPDAPDRGRTRGDKSAQKQIRKRAREEAIARTTNAPAPRRPVSRLARAYLDHVQEAEDDRAVTTTHSGFDDWSNAETWASENIANVQRARVSAAARDAPNLDAAEWRSSKRPRTVQQAMDELGASRLDMEHAGSAKRETARVAFEEDEELQADDARVSRRAAKALPTWAKLEKYRLLHLPPKQVKARLAQSGPVREEVFREQLATDRHRGLVLRDVFVGERSDKGNAAVYKKLKKVADEREAAYQSANVSRLAAKGLSAYDAYTYNRRMEKGVEVFPDSVTNEAAAREAIQKYNRDNATIAQWRKGIKQIFGYGY